MTRYVTALAALCICASPARAQEALLQDCAQALPSQSVPTTVGDQFRFMCAQVVNSFATVQPSVGIAFSGGNPTLGTGSTLGRRAGSVPHVSVTARMNFALAEVPDLFGGYSAQLDNGGTLGALGTTGAPIGSIQGDVAIGVLDGVSLGPAVGGFGSLDLLGSVAILPKLDSIGLSDAIMNIGVGARVGILKQGVLVPALSLSGMYRRMGTIAFGDVEQGDPGAFSANLRTLSFRAVASKGIVAFDVAVGAGYDRYASDIGLDWAVTCATTECTTVNGGNPLRLDGSIADELSTSAWNVFGDVGLDMLLLHVVGEIGYQKAIDPLTVADLESASLPSQPLTTDALHGGRLFASVGLRLSF